MTQELRCDLLPNSVIRTETVLSRFPLHNLVKGNKIKIEIAQKDQNGEVVVKWFVHPNPAFGEPGLLAYKLDTIIINRRIEESGRPIPRTIRLGSLREICRELALSEGENTQTIRKALHQNAATYINTKLKYKGADGKERKLEAGFQRYSVVFTGETLPDARKADAVYLVLNDIYRDVLDTATFRPLDYDYLKSLSPTAQRWYEVISYSMFATNKHKLSTADITYSEYCTYSGQERYFTWEQVKKQMYKLHRPHLKSHYIVSFVHEATTDADGKSDWVLKYVPGPKAKAEYKAFSSTKRKESVKTVDVASIEAVKCEALQPKPEPQTPALTDEEKHFIKELTDRFSIHENTATELVTTKFEQVAHQLEVYPHRQHSRIKDPAAYIIRAIERNYSSPAEYQTEKARKERKEEETKVKALEDARKSHEEAHYATWIRYLGEREGKIKETHHEAYRAFGQCSILEREKFLTSSKPKIREMQGKVYDRTDSHLNRFYQYFKGLPECDLLDFWAWDSKVNPTPFEGERNAKRLHGGGLPS